MQIRSTTTPTAKPLPSSQSTPQRVSTQHEASEVPAVRDGFDQGWSAAGVSVLGGVTALAGGMWGRPLVVAAGSAITAVGSAWTAHRVTSGQESMDNAAWVSLAFGGALTAAGLIFLSSPNPTPTPQGPLPQLLRQLYPRT